MRLKDELAWINTKNKYSIEINSSNGDGVVYSWDNLRDDGIRFLAMLNRFYSFASSVQIPSSHIMYIVRFFEIIFSLSTFRFLFSLILAIPPPPGG
jgi:hypothetical protein